MEVFIAHKMMSRIMDAADLGISAVGYTDTWHIDYTPGLGVGKKRVEEAIQKVADMMEADKDEKMMISSFKVLHLYVKNCDGQSIPGSN